MSKGNANQRSLRFSTFFSSNLQTLFFAIPQRAGKVESASVNAGFCSRPAVAIAFS
jgi:hypothetical protein